MTDLPRGKTARECPPPTSNPAAQPNPVGDDCPCTPPVEPTFPEPDPVEPQHYPGACCSCPTTPSSTSTSCLDGLIEDQAKAIAGLEQTNKSKGDLVKRVEQIKKGAADYTRENYLKLIDDWTQLDSDIAGLVRKLVCSVPCWRCVLECYVCPLLEELRCAEKRLYGGGVLNDNVCNLYDQQYWHTKYLAAKARNLERIKSVLAAWESPTKTIGDAIKQNRTTFKEVESFMGPDPGKAIYSVFLRLVPLHLAIAPPSNSQWQTKIDKQYTEFCDLQDQPDNKCSSSHDDDDSSYSTCCGPDVGERSFRQRLIAPQPYLIDPNQYYTLICCLIEKQYQPANLAFIRATEELAKVSNRISTEEAKLKDGWIKTFEAAVKAAIPSEINCCEYDQPDDDGSKIS